VTAPITAAQMAPPQIAPPQIAPGTDDTALRKVAQELEASFLAEMLKHAGFGENKSAFAGGAGEAQFASFLRAEHARALVERGGIGLSQSLFEALAARATPSPGTDP
jgi:Rod binding domain-containing protein